MTVQHETDVSLTFEYEVAFSFHSKDEPLAQNEMIYSKKID